MRFSILLATSMVGLSIAYRYFALNKPPTPKIVFSWAFILIMLSILGNTPIAGTADMFAYIVVLIIILNDGYEFASKL